MDKDSNYQLLTMQATIEANRKYYNEKMKKLTKYLTAMITLMMDKIKISKYSPDRKYSPKTQDPNTVVLDNKKASSLEGGHSKTIGGMWTLKHEISSPKFYEFLIKIYLKGDTALELKNFYNHINMCLNT